MNYPDMADLLSAISVFLVFLTFLFNSIEKEVSDILATRKPEAAQSAKLNKYKSDLKRIYLLKSWPITLIFIVTSYVLLPNTISILSKSTINFWDFNELKTLFVFIETGLIVLTIYSMIKAYQLHKKIQDH